MNRFILKTYDSSYLDEIINLFILSVKTTCSKDYSEEQILAWISGVDKNRWDSTFKTNYTLVAFDENKIIGFSDISESGYLNMLYVHPDYQHKGVATLLCDKLEEHVKTKVISVDASITAMPFFLKRGYEVIMEQTVVRHGVELINYRMGKEKEI